MMTERMVLYGRISTMDKGLDLELQLSDLTTYARARGGRYSKTILTSDSPIRRGKDLPSIQLMEDAGKRKIDTTLVWKLGRFGG
jgi:DNA invertase Pin-like site-specific DNA recombinase